jgi:hypothetical protein
MFGALGVMKKYTAESNRHLPIVLFYVFEVLLVASAVISFYIDPRKSRVLSAASVTVFLYSFPSQLHICFLLSRVARQHAVIS